MEFKPIETQEQLNELIGERIKKIEARAAQEAAEKYAGFDDLKKQNEDLKAQIQTLQDAAAETSKKLEESAKYKTDLVKTRIALTAGLKMDYADRLRGNNEEEWKADAEALAKDFAAAKKISVPLGDPEPVKKGEPSTRDLFAEWLAKD